MYSIRRQPSTPLFPYTTLFRSPQGQGETDPLLCVREARQSVFPPAIGARARMIVSEEVPGVAVVAVVFANGAPLALAQIRTPLLPGNLLLARRDETFRFRGRVLGLLGLRVHRAAPCRLKMNHRPRRTGAVLLARTLCTRTRPLYWTFVLRGGPPGAVLDPDARCPRSGNRIASPLPSRLALGGMGLSTDPPASDEGPIDCDSRA